MDERIRGRSTRERKLSKHGALIVRRKVSDGFELQELQNS